MSDVLKARTELHRALHSFLAGTAVSIAPPAGYVPFGAAADCPGCDPAQIPQDLLQLGELQSYTYDLTVRRAAELNIPVAGSVSGSQERRVVVWEWTRYRQIPGANGVKCQYGYVIRFCLTVSKWELHGKVTLPFLSAQAELGNLEASWLMQIRGLVGPKVDQAVLPPQELKVETFVIARQSMNAVIQAIGDPTTKFVPGVLLGQINPASVDEKYWQDAVIAFAADSVRRGRTKPDTVAKLASTNSNDLDLIAEVYASFDVQGQSVPSTTARERAETILRGIRVDK